MQKKKQSNDSYQFHEYLISFFTAKSTSLQSKDLKIINNYLKVETSKVLN